MYVELLKQNKNQKDNLEILLINSKTINYLSLLNSQLQGDEWKFVDNGHYKCQYHLLLYIHVYLTFISIWFWRSTTKSTKFFEEYWWYLQGSLYARAHTMVSTGSRHLSTMEYSTTFPSRGSRGRSARW